MLVHHTLGGVILGLGLDLDLATENSIDDAPAQNLERLSDGSPQVRRLHDDFDLCDPVIAPPPRNFLDRNEGASKRTLDNPHVANVVDVMLEHGVWLENLGVGHGCYCPALLKVRKHNNTTGRNKKLNSPQVPKIRLRNAPCIVPKQEQSVKLRRRAA